MRTHIGVVIAACMLVGAILQPFAFEQKDEASVPATLSFVQGIPLSPNECASVVGGDVRMSLNAKRTAFTVNVIDNEYEARLGRIPPKQVLVLDAHNRVVDTIHAPFMPANAQGRQLAGSAAATSKPSQFPAGYWNISAIKPRSDKYGPYMIATDAVGNVEVFVEYSAGCYMSAGTYNDIGYALHANTNAFEYSKSYGCVVMKAADVETLAAILRQDKAENPRASQKIYIREP